MTSLLVTAATLAVLMSTGPDFGIVWDEGYTIGRERLLDAWFRRADPMSATARRFALEPETLDRYWPFSRAEPDGHPPFYALLGLAGWRLSHRWLAPLEAYRFGPMVLTALTAGAITLHLARRRGRLAGVSAALFLVLMPRVFAHAHYAHYDMPMTCLWLLVQLTFLAGLTSTWWSLPFGVALGLCAGTKFTGLFAVVPPAVWVAWVEICSWRRRSAANDPSVPGVRPGLRTLALGLPVTVFTLYAIQPPWWREPIAGPWRFMASNLTREQSQPIPTLYLGHVSGYSLPWHNTLVLTAVTTPLAVLALGVLGLATALGRSRRDPAALIWPLSWLTLMIVRALPNAPGHDGVRLFLPSVASLAVLAGLGVAWIAERSGLWSRLAAALLVGVAVAECLAGIVQVYPYTDSYYNAAIGGLPGAERAGFELTYYWETSGPELLDWAGREARRRPVRLRFDGDSMIAFNQGLLREWGTIPAGVNLVASDREPPGPAAYVQQRRRGCFYPWDWWLEHRGRPEYAIRRQGVDLLRVFPDDQLGEAQRRTFRVFAALENATRMLRESGRSDAANVLDGYRQRRFTWSNEWWHALGLAVRKTEREFSPAPSVQRELERIMSEVREVHPGS